MSVTQACGLLSQTPAASTRSRGLDQTQRSIDTRAMTVTVSAFYKFVSINDCDALQSQIRNVLAAHAIKGTVLIASEGINATVSGTDNAIDGLHTWLSADPRFKGLSDKRSIAPDHPFQKLKVKIKPEIVTFGAADADPSRHVGTYVAPNDWNALIENPDVIVVDTRNSYEVSIGTFPGAKDPGTRAFSEFPDFVDKHLAKSKDKPIAMFCTGGIRCEKASAYLLSQGFPDVYHLEGGILKYLEVVPPAQSLWQGECFVFDDRVALEHGVKPGKHIRCVECGDPISQKLAGSETGTTPMCAKCGSKI